MEIYSANATWFTRERSIIDEDHEESIMNQLVQRSDLFVDDKNVIYIVDSVNQLENTVPRVILISILGRLTFIKSLRNQPYTDLIQSDHNYPVGIHESHCG